MLAFFRVPATSGEGHGGVNCDVYINLNPFKHTNLMGCCVGMAKCLQREKDVRMALAWCEQVNSLHRCGSHTAEHEHPLHGIGPSHHSSGLCVASEIFASLENSGTAVTRRSVATQTMLSLPDPH
ncbi:hypothetical protein B0H13DRAFT_1885631 [Mycena leptocephala]|nr:hypothetical protein B0H13DRAFT_1885631 [Mycena leptocephala]